MTEPPTLVLWDADEEQTLVDRARLSGPEPAFTASVHSVPENSRGEDRGRAKHEAKQSLRAGRLLLSRYRREIFEISAALTVLVGLGSVVYQQRLITNALRETLTDVRARRQESGAARSDALPRSQEPLTREQVERRALIKELAPHEREALERQAAALIASNDFPAALRQYATLAELFPDDRTLRDVVTVLRAKLRCDPSSSFSRGACR